MAAAVSFVVEEQYRLLLSNSEDKISARWLVKNYLRPELGGKVFIETRGYFNKEKITLI